MEYHQSFVIAEQLLPVLISADSGVKENEWADTLPPEIVQALQAMQKKADPLIELVNEVRTWLQAIRYEVSEPQQREDHVDMIATLEQGTLKQRVLVRCIDGEIWKSHVDGLDEALDRKTPQGWLISDRRVSDLARARAAEDDGLQVFSLSDFLRQMVWRPYIDALTALVERDRIPELYVDPSCYRQQTDEGAKTNGQDPHTSLDAYLDNWLKERSKLHISLLGEFGSGKTWFCRHYAYRQLGRYLEDPANERLPLLITLRTFAKAMTPQQLINDALVEQYKLPFVGSAFGIFQEMNRRKKLLLILDGFDEMARQVDYQTVVDNFWELATLVDEGSKVILTSRTEYFRWAKESERVFSGEEFGRHTIVLSPPKFEVLHLQPFTEGQIREVIIRRLGDEKGPAMADRILETPNLGEMARKPILIELLLSALDEVSADVLENPAQVYLYATEKLLLRNIETKRTFTTTADKLFFLCELAWEMISSGNLRIHYKDIPDRVEMYFGDKIEKPHELDNWDFDLRNQTLLHRDAHGYYEFAHKSLAEYFVAFKFAAELGCMDSTFAHAYREEDGVPCDLPIAEKNVFELAETFGAIALSDNRLHAVSALLRSMLSRHCADRLWAVIDQTKNELPEQTALVGGNAATLLHHELGESFIGRELPRTVLAGAQLGFCDLTRSNLEGVCLKDAKLEFCCLEGANLCGANLQNTVFDDTYIVWSTAFNPDGTRLAVADGHGYISIWDAESGHELCRSQKFVGATSGVCWSEDGQYVATLLMRYTDTPRIHLLKASDLVLVQSLEFDPPKAFGDLKARIRRQVTFEREDSVLYSLSTLKISLNPADLETGSELREINSDMLGHYGVAYQRIAQSAGMDDWTYQALWNWCRKPPAVVQIDRDHALYLRPTVELVARIRTEEGVGEWFIYPDPPGECLHLLESGVPSQMSFSKDDGWDGWHGGRLRLPASQNLVHLSYSQDGSLIATAVGDPEAGSCVRIWDNTHDSSTHAQRVRVLEPYKGNFRGMLISGATGLGQTQVVTFGKVQEATLLEFFAERGAILDKAQKKALEETRRRRAAKSEEEPAPGDRDE